MKALLPHVAACSTLCRERVQWVGAAALNWVNRPYLDIWGNRRDLPTTSSECSTTSSTGFNPRRGYPTS